MHQDGYSKIIFSFFGPPGSGKGTVAEMCVQGLGFKVLSTGNLFRKHISLGTDFGKLIKDYIDIGKLVPDEFVGNIVLDWLKDAASSGMPIILDGYPRTSGQAEHFFKTFKDFAPDYEFRVIYFIISDEEVIKRLTNRFVCQNKNCQAVYPPFAPAVKKGICDLCGEKIVRRKDDSVEVVKDRLRQYPRYKDDLLSYYKKTDLLVESFDVEGKSIENVFKSFKEDYLNGDSINGIDKE
ncbi:nucleoside monophosphate kinase [Candidatus Babeliales bacterium]|nr:nucleoside monophosphate kinase [Candidatus Babeliales bacterium]